MGIEFLTELYKQGKSYSTINSARSALSQFLLPEGSQLDTDFGKHKLTSMFMKGVFKLKPPTPKYKGTWDVKIVLDYLRTLDNDNISLKLLFMKCVTILAMATKQKSQALTSLGLNESTFYES